MRGLPDFKLPDLRACMAANLAAAQLTNPAARFVGIAVNTSQMDKGLAPSYLKRLPDDFGLPAVDPFASLFSPIVVRLPLAARCRPCPFASLLVRSAAPSPSRAPAIPPPPYILLSPFFTPVTP